MVSYAAVFDWSPKTPAYSRHLNIEALLGSNSNTAFGLQNSNIKQTKWPQTTMTKMGLNCNSNKGNHKYSRQILTVTYRGGSRGGCRGCGGGGGGGPPPPPPPWDHLRFSNTTGILQKEKKTMWFIGVDVEQDTSAPPPAKKNSWIRPWHIASSLVSQTTASNIQSI